MSRVEMNLEEYDQMKEKLRAYEEIIEALTATSVNESDIKKYKDGEIDSFNIWCELSDNLSRGAKNLLQTKIRNNALTTLRESGVVGDLKLSPITHTLNTISMHIGCFNKFEKES